MGKQGRERLPVEDVPQARVVSQREHAGGVLELTAEGGVLVTLTPLGAHKGYTWRTEGRLDNCGWEPTREAAQREALYYARVYGNPRRRKGGRYGAPRGLDRKIHF